jgi:uncharacterized Zn finger protein
MMTTRALFPREPRENVELKGRRYLTEGRLLVHQVTPNEIRATARGNGWVYALGFNEGSWFCGCPAIGRCSHLVALQLVTTAPRSA